MSRIINVDVDGAFLTKSGKNAGTQGESNVTSLHITFDQSWLNMGKRIVWRDAKGESPVAVVLFSLPVVGTDPLIFDTLIPAEPLAEPGWCSFTIEGFAEVDGVFQTQITIQDFLQVYINDTFYSPAEPTPTQSAQILAEMANSVTLIQGYATESKSWAVGGTASRTGEDTDNAKYYSQLAEASATAADGSATDAATSETNAQTSATTSQSSAANAQTSATTAQSASAAAVVAQLAAEDAAARAEAAVGGDFVKTADFNEYKTTTDTHINSRSNPHAVTAEQVGAVPTTRTVNGKALSTNISLTAGDVGALDSTVAASKTYVDTGLATKQNTLTFDTAPTQNSANPVTSGGLYNIMSPYEGQLLVKYNLVTELIKDSSTWELPAGVKDNTVNVRLFGGGGGGLNNTASNAHAGGGGGYMETGVYQLLPREKVLVTIGAGGTTGTGSPTAGGLTSFGTYLSANGGSAGASTGGGDGGTGGGGWAKSGGCKGGLGSYGGGGGGASGMANSSAGAVAGGNGGTYGGGGGSACSIGSNSSYTFAANGANGGTYGGGSGACNAHSSTSAATSATGGNGGTYGGAGGSTTQINGLAGTNTTALDVEYKGTGVGGTGQESKYNTTTTSVGAGSGGGYGGVGGNGSASVYNTYPSAGASGGGGGYGGNGGNASTLAVSGNAKAAGGGGGGYGANGGNASTDTNGGYGGGGGGYAGGHGRPGTDGSLFGPGGGGGYGLDNYGAGGSGGAMSSVYPSVAGICIITYYQASFQEVTA